MNINKEIEKLDWSKEPQGLYAPIAYTLEAGGKRLRPQLALTGAAIFGGQEEDTLPAALALEVFHNFTLLHDDVMDKAEVRRGRPTVHMQWNENTAILSGDQMLIEAYKLLAQIESSKLPQVLRYFNEMGTEICEGQQYDMDFEQRDDVTIDEYMEMIRLKTSVLLANALRIGAYLANASESAQEALYRYGIHLGLAFQLQDDLLDVYGDPVTFGKSIGGDICCNKKTFMLLTAQQKAQKEQLIELQQWLDAPASEAKIKAVTALYTKLGVRTDAEKAIEAHTHEALAQLDKLPQNEATEQLRLLAHKLETRKK